MSSVKTPHPDGRVICHSGAWALVCYITLDGRHEFRAEGPKSVNLGGISLSQAQARLDELSAS